MHTVRIDIDRCIHVFCRKSEYDVMLDTHVNQLHNCAERHHKLRQVMELLERVHQQGVTISTPEVLYISVN